MPLLHHKGMLGGQWVKLGGKWRCVTMLGAPASALLPRAMGNSWALGKQGASSQVLSSI